MRLKLQQSYKKIFFPCCKNYLMTTTKADANRISLWTVCAMLTCCLVFTILTVMIMGVGIGYHYCFVQSSVDAMAAAAKSAGAVRSGPERQGNVMRSIDRAVRRGFAHRVARRDADGLPLTNNFNDTTLNLNYTMTNNNNVTGY